MSEQHSVACRLVQASRTTRWFGGVLAAPSLGLALLIARPAAACEEPREPVTACLRTGLLAQGGALRSGFDYVYGLGGVRAHLGGQLGGLGTISPGIIGVPSVSVFIGDGVGLSLDLALIADLTIANRLRIGAGPDFGGVTGGSSKATGLYYGGRFVVGAYPWIGDAGGATRHRLSVSAELRVVQSTVAGAGLGLSPLAVIGWEAF